MKCEFIDSEWFESLIWCPSQLLRRFRCGSYVFTLYLRWRYDDPWQFFIALGDMFDKDSEWEFVTDDLFEKYGLFFRDVEYKEAERRAEELFMQVIDDIIRNIVRNAAS